MTAARSRELHCLARTDDAVCVSPYSESGINRQLGRVGQAFWFRAKGPGNLASAQLLVAFSSLSGRRLPENSFLPEIEPGEDAQPDRLQPGDRFLANVLSGDRNLRRYPRFAATALTKGFGSRIQQVSRRTGLALGVVLGMAVERGLETALDLLRPDAARRAVRRELERSLRNRHAWVGGALLAAETKARIDGAKAAGLSYEHIVRLAVEHGLPPALDQIRREGGSP